MAKPITYREQEKLENTVKMCIRDRRKVIRYAGIGFALIFAFFIIYSLLAMIMPSIIESIISIIND